MFDKRAWKKLLLMMVAARSLHNSQDNNFTEDANG